MEHQEKMYHLEYQRNNSKEVYEEIVSESGLLDIDGPLKFIKEKERGQDFSVGNAAVMFHEDLESEIDWIQADPGFSFIDSVNMVKSLMDNWKACVPVDLMDVPFSKLSAVQWLDKSGQSHLVIGKDPIEIVQTVFVHIRDADRLSIREISREDLKAIEERLGREAEERHNVVQSTQAQDALMKDIVSMADSQLDGKAHWMFMNEPDFRSDFSAWVSHHLDAYKYTSQDIQNAIQKEGNDLDRYVSRPLDRSDINRLFETVVMFSNNKFMYAKNHPWSIFPSTNPQYPYDWILYHKSYPIVQYDSKSKSIDSCFEIGKENLNEICSVIRSAAKKKNGEYILSAADNAKMNLVR